MAARRVFTLPEAARVFAAFDRPLQDAIIVGGNEGMTLAVRIITSSPIMQQMSTARDAQTGAFTQRPNPAPGPLGKRSGDLAKSVSFIPFRRQGNEIRGGHFTVGVKYGMIHERGGVIQHPGSTKFQRFSFQGSIIFTRGTKPHAIRIPARPYLRPGALRALPTMGKIIERRIALAAAQEGLLP